MHNLSFLTVPDSFKDCMDAEHVGLNLEKGIKKIFPDAKTKVIPMADGGEGTVTSIVKACSGEIIECKALDPLGRETDAFFGVINNGKTAIIEMAAASGIEKLSLEQRNPWITSTFGTGELIKYALDYGCTKIVIGIGGSATNDAGMGMAKALGVTFYNSKSIELEEGGGALSDLERIDISNIDSRLKTTEIIAATDVVSPLTGMQGASHVFAPQKGADPRMVEKLDCNLKNYANKVREYTKLDIEQMPGSGAAGGLGAGLYAFAGARLESGLDVIVDLIGLEKHIESSDIIFTAEGKVDGQTSEGKTPVGIARIAKKHNKPVFVFTGNATTNTIELYNNGISAVIPITRKPVDLRSALKKAPIWLEKASEEVCIGIKVGLERKKS